MASKRRNKNQQTPNVHSRPTSPTGVGKATGAEKTTPGGRSYFWNFVDGGLIVTVICFAFWIGELNNKVGDHKEKLKEFELKLTSDTKELSAKITSEVKEIEARISNGGVLARRYRGDESELHRRRQFQFMTPSDDTWHSKVKFYGESSAFNGGQEVRLDDFKWQNVTDQRVEEFGRQIISNGFAKGWRRYPYAGQGRFRDVGWWWVVTVDEGFDIERFVDHYRQFWGTSEMYVEEFEAHSDVMPDGVIPHPVLPNPGSTKPSSTGPISNPLKP